MVCSEHCTYVYNYFVFLVLQNYSSADVSTKLSLPRLHGIVLDHVFTVKTVLGMLKEVKIKPL